MKLIIKNVSNDGYWNYTEQYYRIESNSKDELALQLNNLAIHEQEKIKERYDFSIDDSCKFESHLTLNDKPVYLTVNCFNDIDTALCNIFTPEEFINTIETVNFKKS